MSQAPSSPINELDRVLNLSDFDIDFTNLDANFKDLTKLAALIAGTDISLVGLIDTYTEWTISGYGLEATQTPRDETVCQYTIKEESYFEVPDMALDERFRNFECVTGSLALKYYLGVPLTTEEGYNIGALCVMDTRTKQIPYDKILQLKVLASEIVSKLKAIKMIEQLNYTVKDIKTNQKRVVHDIRGPVGGIVGLADIVCSQGADNDMDEVLEYMDLIKKSGESVLDLANEIMKADKKAETNYNTDFTLLDFKQKLEELYIPQALNKNINYSVVTSALTEEVPCTKNKLLQITGNLISNAIKFTPDYGIIQVDLNLEVEEFRNRLTISVKDTGIGLSQERIDSVLNAEGVTTMGTSGEEGFGFGLVMVKNLIESLKGTLDINSVEGEGTEFVVVVPC
jgi:signal transduction histidine kinase